MRRLLALGLAIVVPACGSDSPTSPATVVSTTTTTTTVPPPIFVRSGRGANVFDMPTYVRRIRIEATYGGRCENFVVRIAGRLVVNEILGNCSVAGNGRDYDGTFATTGGVTEITFSNGIDWLFTELR